MNSEPISIITPAYNAEKFIRRTIDSVLAQSYANFEMLILDDGSNDKTRKEIECIKNQDRRIKYFYQANKGLAVSRNRLCNMANGEYIAFLDHDDEWLPDKLQVQMDVFKRNQECVLVYGNVMNVYSDNRTKNHNSFDHRLPRKGNVFYSYLIEGNFMPQPSIIIKSEILKQYLPFSAKFKIAVDWELLLRISRNHSFDYVNQVVARYNVHNQRESAKNVLLEIEEVLSIMDFWYKNDPNLRSLYQRSYLRAKAKVHMQKVYHYQASGNINKELKEMLTCIHVDPTWHKPYLKLIKTVVKTIIGSTKKLLTGKRYV